MANHYEYAPPLERCQLCLFPIEEDEKELADVESQNGQSKKVNTAHRVRETPANGEKTMYHKECRRHVGTPRDSFFAATKSAFVPHPMSDRARRQNIKNILCRGLQTTMQHAKLPAEVWLKVADELVYLYAALDWQAVFCVHSHAVDEAIGTVDLSQDVWAHSINVEGVRYICRLSNNRDVLSKSDVTLLFPRGKVQVGDTLLVLKDHLGIQQLVLEGEDVAMPPPSLSRWWKRLNITSVVLDTESDDLKLRAITDKASADPFPLIPQRFKNLPVYVFPGKQSSLNSLNTAWSDPATLKSSLFYVNLRTIEVTPPIELRMMSVDVNAADVLGYVAYVKDFMVSLVPQRNAEPDWQHYHDMELYSPEGDWMYLPMSPGERLEHIYALQLPRGMASVAFRTSAGRVLVIGPRFFSHVYAMSPETPQYNYMCSLPPYPTKMHYNLRPDGAELMAIEGGFLVPNSSNINKYITWEDMLIASGHIPHITRLNMFGRCFVPSAANMHGVVQITPCIRAQPIHAISGFLLKYADGHRDCVGAFRLDRAGEPVDIDGSSAALHLGFRAVGCHAEVAQFATTNPPLSEYQNGLTWMAFPWKERLEWWFEKRQCQIFHGNQFSPFSTKSSISYF